MKKIIVILLASCLCISLCACNSAANEKVNQTNINPTVCTPAEDDSINYHPSEYVGVWVTYDYKGEVLDSFQLLSNGKALIEGKATYDDPVDEAAESLFGGWMVENSQLIVFYQINGAVDAASFKIISETEVVQYGDFQPATYHKK